MKNYIKEIMFYYILVRSDKVHQTVAGLQFPTGLKVFAWIFISKGSVLPTKIR